MAKLTGIALAGALAVAAVDARADVFEDQPALLQQVAAVRVMSHAASARLQASQRRQVAAHHRRRNRPHGPRKPHRIGHDHHPKPRPAYHPPDVSSYPVRGIDVSHYQDVIDWDKVKTAGLSFVYIKATDGDDIQDDQFKRNWEGATRAGLLKGAYHFYDFCTDPEPQFANLLKVLPKEPGMLPPFIDLERSVECKPKDMPTKEEFLQDFAVFVDAVRKAYGMKPILYLEPAIYHKYLEGIAEDYVIWFPDPDDNAPDVPSGLTWTFWQYSFKGRVAGIDGEVDLDVFAGDRQQLAALARAASGIVSR
ncbi:MAG: GH25 family lysozyme [Elusimicrobia bacterium]|nr:GH25 family lysozyme [Elusimicrobiota bacterium]